MTLSTSAVAVCCWSDSRSSFSSRAFSMAMTACVHQFDLLVRERPDFLAVNGKCPDQLVIFEHRHINRRPRAAELHRRKVRCAFSSIVIGVAYLFCLFDTI